MAQMHDADRLSVGGRVDVEIRDAKLGDRLLVVVEADLRAFEEVSSAHQGDFVTAKARCRGALLLTEEQASDFAETFERMRHEREESGVKGQVKLPDEYTNLDHDALMKLAIARLIPADGSDDQIRRRLRQGDRKGKGRG
jgi:hypothetical protein